MFDSIADFSIAEFQNKDDLVINNKIDFHEGKTLLDIDDTIDLSINNSGLDAITSFRRAEFNSFADFFETKFDINVDFYKTIFFSGASFINTEFKYS